MTNKKLGKLVEEWRQVLLPSWRVTIVEKQPDGERDDAWAIAYTRQDYEDVDIWFAPELLDREDEYVECIIVHELLHPLTRAWRYQIASLKGILSYDAAELLHERREHEEEKLVDHLAKVLVATKYADPTILTGTRNQLDA